MTVDRHNSFVRYGKNNVFKANFSLSLSENLSLNFFYIRATKNVFDTINSTISNPVVKVLEI